MTSRSNDFVVLGGGVAGLCFARELLKAGRSVTVLENAPVLGGLARTLHHDGFRFDLGGHRFHSNNPDVVGWAQELLGDALIDVDRRSRIYMGDRFVDYPIQFPGALRIFPPSQAARVAMSYLGTFRPGRRGPDVSFEDWVVRRFGRALYEVYFRPYTEKVWGLPCDQISADWASARIGIPSLAQTLRRAVFPGRRPPATAITRFYYPRAGFGMICERLAEEVVRMGGRIETRATPRTLVPGREDAELIWSGPDGAEESIRAGMVVSTIPLDSLLGTMRAQPGAAEVANRFHLDYRGIILICVALARPQASRDNWTYFPGSEFLIGRTHEPKNWSPEMVPAEDVTSLAIEVYSSMGEPSWQASDAELVDRAASELERVGWIRKGELIGSWVLRIRHAYPVYRIGYGERLRQVREFVERWPTVRLLGRTGSFKYMNSDGVVEDCLQLIAKVAPGEGSRARSLDPIGRWV